MSNSGWQGRSCGHGWSELSFLISGEYEGSDDIDPSHSGLTPGAEDSAFNVRFKQLPIYVHVHRICSSRHLDF